MKRILIAVVLAGTLFGPVFTTPAKACSCAIPGDIAAWVDQSEAAFVGTLIDRRDIGGGPFGEESVFVFEVEAWVKGDAGEVIEVRSASNGAACGLEFWEADNRIGAILYTDDGQLRSDLCSQVDPDVLLAVAPPDAGVGPPLSGSPQPTTPPLVLEPDLVVPDSGDSQIVAMVVLGVAIVGLILLITMTKGPRRAPPPPESLDD